MHACVVVSQLAKIRELCTACVEHLHHSARGSTEQKVLIEKH